MTQHYVGFEKRKHSLVLTPTKQGVEEAREWLEGREDGGDDGLLHMIEYQLANGWMWIPPEAVGALTDAPIVSDDFIMNDAGDVVPAGRGPWAIYAHMAYETQDPVRTWSEGKPVYFVRAEVEKKKVRKVKPTKRSKSVRRRVKPRSLAKKRTSRR